MEYFITVIGLLVYSDDVIKPYSFFVKWNNVQSYETYYKAKAVNSGMKITFTLNDNTKTTLYIDDEEFFIKLIKGLNQQVMSDVMYNNKQAKIEVDCGR